MVKKKAKGNENNTYLTYNNNERRYEGSRENSDKMRKEGAEAPISCNGNLDCCLLSRSEAF